MSTEESQAHPDKPEIAFYYPGPVWRSGNWVKNLILFFDGIALLVPNYIKDKPERLDPAITVGLREHNLLHILEPETVVDNLATQKLAAAMTDVITSGALDPLSNEQTEFHELSYSRLGGFGDAGLANMIFEELKARGLARDSEDGYSIPMHPTVRALVLVLLAQILRSHGDKTGIELSPATDRPILINSLVELLSLPSSPSSGRVVAFDLETVGVDLSAVPIDEVLSFRQEYLQDHKRYVRAVRQYVRELSELPENERALAFEVRQNEIEEMAHALKRVSRKAWKKPAAFGLSLVGAAWRLANNDPIGAILSVSTAVVGAELTAKKPETGAYSYLFRASERFAY